MKKYNLTDEQYKKIASLAVQENDEAGVSNEVSLMANLFEMQTKYKNIYDYIRYSGWFSRAEYWMDKNLASQAAIKKTIDVLKNANRTLPTNIDEHDCFGDIVYIKVNGKTYTNKDNKEQIRKRSNYIKDKTIIYNAYKSTYTFYCFAHDGKYADPMGYTKKASTEQKTAESTKTNTSTSKPTANADKVISVAEAEVGYLEKKSNSNLDSKTANAGSGNYTKYWRDMDKSLQGSAWCDCFVSWCFKQAYGSSANTILCGGLHCFYTPDSAQYYKNSGRWYAKPQRGDQIFFRNSERICHTGIVYKVDSSKVYTIEGNTSAGSQVIPNGGAVCKKSYDLSNSRIAGYGRPKYDTTATSSSSSAQSSPSSTVSTKLNESVKWTGTVNVKTYLSVRKWAGTENAECSFSPLHNGDKVGVCDTIKSDSGDNWYYISYNGKQGFVSAKYIKK